MISTLGTALGAGLSAVPFAGFANETPTYIQSEDIDGRSELNNNFDLNFLAIGDWGRNGADHQLKVAKQMGKWASENPNNFIISTGDNFYPSGVVSEHDPLWRYSYEDIYKEFAMQWDWYPILGNHDYKSDPDAQVRYTKISRRWKMPARYYSKTFRLKNGEKVLMAFIDTNPMIPAFYENSEYGPHVAGQQPEKQLEWLGKLLDTTTARWKIVVGHHPVYTAGPRTQNYDTLAVREVLTPVLEKHKVDLYLSGHEHSMQHLKSKSDHFHQFISGAGSETTPVKQETEHKLFAAAAYGFMYFSIDSHQIRVKVINHEGKETYNTTVQKR